MDLFSVLELIGGIGLFLYGMKYLGNSLGHLAGAKLETTLQKLTSNRLKGLGLGVFVTAIIQSSAATTIMLVGFANAGIMSLSQSVPVLLGANIGTTATGQILRLGDLSSNGGSVILSLLKPFYLSCFMIGIAAFCMLISKSKKVNNIASIMMGFGILFVGMNTMETALEPLSSSEAFRSAFTTFSNPFIGFLLGILLSAILQSSSAAVGIVQAVTSTGTVSFAVAAPIVIGISIGKLFPIILASIGTKKEAKQVTLSQFLVSAIGGVISMLVLYLVASPLGLVNWDAIMTRGNVADLNTVYNIIVSLCFIPFCGPLSKLSKLIIKDDAPSKINEELSLLDDIFLKTPSVALEQCRKVIISMGTTAVENFRNAVSTHDTYSEEIAHAIEDNELFLDRSETCLSDYMVKVTACSLLPEEQKLSSEILHSIMDLERIGDHCVKISEVAEYNRNSGLVFSDIAKKELAIMYEAVGDVLNTTINSFIDDNMDLALHVEPLAELISIMGESIKENHVSRLQAGDCTVQSGISLVEILTSLDRISAYCSNVALHVIEKHTEGSIFDIHGYAKEMHTSSPIYKNLYFEYSKKYMVPLENLSN